MRRACDRRKDLELDLATEPMLKIETKKAILNRFLRSTESEQDPR